MTLVALSISLVTFGFVLGVGASLGDRTFQLAVGGVLGTATIISAALALRPLDLEPSREAAMAEAYEEGIALLTFMKIAVYKAAVLALTDDGVTAAEREERRLYAYHAASLEALPHHVREAAADALSALGEDSPDETRVDQAMAESSETGTVLP
ncbi:hypothetical protein [Streptomyces sp. NPDC059076]|uniref:hypothetical protein n=1 Tax=unclassified Streptomyces TaxID=2593676 RepID=UPI003682A808